MDSTFQIISFQAKFEPISILGQGGYGCVFEVKKSVMRKVAWKRAVKRIALKRNDSDAQSALKEVESLLLLDHPGIVRFYDSWVEKPPDGWQYYFDQELVKKLNYKGELCDSTLADWLKNNKDRDAVRMKHWFKQIVSAVSYIHDTGMIHRDLKPDNIVFANKDRLKICDFGIATNRAIVDLGQGLEEMSRSRTFDQGTDLYMAPEQKWDSYSSKVDIYALGLILTELCIVMTDKEKRNLFEYFLIGKPDSLIESAIEQRMGSALKNFVTSLTSSQDSERPDCKQILHEIDPPDRFSSLIDSLESSNSGIDRFPRKGLDFADDESFDSEFLMKFKPQRIIGEGGFGVVFEAINIIDECAYAVKRIPVKGSAKALNEALLELRGLSRLDHPGIANNISVWIEKQPEGWQYVEDARIREKLQTRTHSLLNYEPKSHFVYIQMQKDNYSLSEWFRNNCKPESRPVPRMKMWFRQMLSAVNYIHGHLLIHRQLKANSTVYSSKVDIFALGLILAQLCDVMTIDKAAKVFNGYRRGKPNSRLDGLPKVKAFVTWLTKVTPDERPTCEEILMHPFLA